MCICLMIVNLLLELTFFYNFRGIRIEMGSYLQKPVVDKSSDEGTGPENEYKWGSTAMQGWRTNMEDAHIHMVAVIILSRDLYLI